jgi:hypothetical protein
VTLVPLLLNAVGSLRGAKGFVWREKADGVIGAVIIIFIGGRFHIILMSLSLVGYTRNGACRAPGGTSDEFDPRQGGVRQILLFYI